MTAAANPNGHGELRGRDRRHQPELLIRWHRSATLIGRPPTGERVVGREIGALERPSHVALGPIDDGPPDAIAVSGGMICRSQDGDVAEEGGRSRPAVIR
jgi:hypothetical protein